MSAHSILQKHSCVLSHTTGTTVNLSD